MNINRHNYEEFFLLYIDRELTPDERLVVEKFIIENPDLAGELEILQQALLHEDTVQFDGKEQLYKKEAGISLNNYEQYFLLAVDNELGEREKHEVEKFVLQHPAVQNEFTLLQQTKLQGEPLIFKGKKELYRYEKTRRLIPVAWARLSVAAAVLGLVVTMLLFNTPDSPQATATVNKVEILPKKSNPPVDRQPAAAENVVAAVPVKEAQKKLIKQKQPILSEAGKNKQEPENEVQQNRNVAANNQSAINELKATINANDNDFKVEKNIPETRKNIGSPLASESGSSSPKIKSGNETKATTSFAKQETNDEPVLVQHTLYREIEADEEEKTLYIGSSQINKNKLKGLFKKASGFLGKTLGGNQHDRLLQ